MPSIFMSHTSIDKPFVEKLAKDLQRLGIKAWYDKWEIKVGESLLWKIEEGIKVNDYLGIVLSEEAMKSKWVRAELSAAWEKQMEIGKRFILPIYYRECEIPVLLKDLKYADFRLEYEVGLLDLVKVFGIRKIDAITEDNWRRFTYSKSINWKRFRDLEFAKLVTNLCDLAYDYNWSAWVGRTQNPYSITLSGFFGVQDINNISIKLMPLNSYRYMGCFTKQGNPNRNLVNEYNIEIGTTVNEVEEFVWNELEKITDRLGKPNEKPTYFTEFYPKPEEVMIKAREFVKEFDWYKGEKIKK